MSRRPKAKRTQLTPIAREYGRRARLVTRRAAELRRLDEAHARERASIVTKLEIARAIADALKAKVDA